MPNISVTIPDVEQSVLRPIVFDIIGQVQQITKITDKAEIFWPGDMQKMQTAGSDIDGSEQNRFPIFDTARIAFIEVEETYDQNALGTTAVSREEQIPVFEDPALGVAIAPVCVTSDVKINFRYRTNSKTEAKRWMDDMRIRISTLRDVNTHKITYSYGLPLPIREVICEIYDKREAVEPYGQTLGQFVTSRATERLTIIGDQVGKNVDLAISETQGRINGLFDYTAMPDKPERDDATGTYTVTFSYKFSYEKPIGCNMKYPIMVHNQLLNPAFTEFNEKETDPTYVAKSFSKSLSAFFSFESNTILNAVVPLEPYIKIPSFDDYLIPQVPQGTGTSLMVLTSVEDNKVSLFNLGELGDVEIDPDIMQFIREVEWPFICKQFLSILHLTLYVDSFQQSTGSIDIDSNLNIFSTSELNRRRQHRVRLGICVDLTLLPAAAMTRLMAYPKAFTKILGSMNELLRYNQGFANLGDKNFISRIEFSEVYYVLTGYGYNNGSTGRPVDLYNRRPPVNAMFKDIDPRVIENYRNNMITRKTVQVNYIVGQRLQQA